jgi:hypothetical protein
MNGARTRWSSGAGRKTADICRSTSSPEDVDASSLSPEDLAAISEGIESVVIRIIHAMDLTPKMLRQYRKLRRGR